MLSRVADSLFWMSRYIERAEDITRILTVNFHALLDLPVQNSASAWQPLVSITGDANLFEETFEHLPQRYTPRVVSEFLLWHPANPNAVVTCIIRARENARSIREQISTEMWECLNKLYFYVKDINRPAVLRGPHDFFAQVRDGSHAFQGITNATQPHNDSYDFIQLGKYLERAEKTTRIIDVKYAGMGMVDEGSPEAQLQLLAMLRSCSAMEAYRKTGHPLQTWRVAEFLLSDRDFPRSLLFCLEHCRTATNSISGDMRNNAQRAFGKLVSDTEFVDIHEVLGEGMHPYLDGMQTRLNHAGDEIARTFFNTQVVLPGSAVVQQAQQQQ